MSHSILKYLLPFLILFVLSAAKADAQDYDTFPVLDFKFSHLNADLSFMPADRSLSGTVTYTISAKNSDAGRLILLQSGLAVDSVMINGETTEFEKSDSTIEIQVPERIISSGRDFTLEISYATTSQDVFLKTSSGTVFTSLMPLRRSEWMPVFEHPRVAFTTHIKVEVPGDLQMISNGYPESEVMLENGNKRVEWRSETPVPSTDLVLLAGNLEVTETMLGVKSVRIYSEPGTVTSELRNMLMREASQTINSMQRNLRFEFPYDAFSVVVLQDHMWEPRMYAASFGMLSMNAYGLTAQLRRVIAAQWFGAYHRSETVAEAGTQLFMQAALLHGTEDAYGTDPSVYDYPDAVYFRDYDAFTLSNWSYWRSTFAALSDSQRQAVSSGIQQLFRMNRSVYNWKDYMEVWYNETGRPLEQVVLPDRAVENGDTAERKIVNVAFEPDQERSGAVVIVEPREELGRDSLLIPLKIIGRSETIRQELMVFRTGGEFFVEFGIRPVNITVDHDAVDGIEFFEIKGLEMWLHQLRSDENADNRRRAAEMMPRFRDDPDIQLAMQDFLRREENSRVRTAMIRSLSDIVEGASGTQQVFVEMSRTAQGEELHAAVDAMWHYQGNEAAISAVGRVAQQSTYQPAAVAAIGVFRRIAPAEQFNELSRSLLLGSRPAAVRAAVVEELYRADNEDVAIFTSMDVLESTTFPYAMRDRALRMLIRYNHTTELAEVLPGLTADPDPRIRYLAIANLDRLSANQMNDLLERRFELERDPRVRSAFDEFY